MAGVPEEKRPRGILLLSREEQMRLISEQLLQAAMTIHTRQFAQVPRELSEARELCERVLPQQAAATKVVLEDVAHRLQIWRNAWPRLKTDLGFRMAVARELRLWAQQLVTPLARKRPPKPTAL